MANYSKIALNNVPISEEECMGDSLVTINEALLTLADGINKLDGLFGDVTNCDTTVNTCLLYTSPSPRDRQKSRMPSSA